MEADKTNEFLQALATAATDGGVNRQAALASVLGVISQKNYTLISTPRLNNHDSTFEIYYFKPLGVPISRTCTHHAP